MAEISKEELVKKVEEARKNYLHYSFLEEYLTKMFDREMERGNEKAYSEIAQIFPDIQEKARKNELKYYWLSSKLRRGRYST